MRRVVFVVGAVVAVLALTLALARREAVMPTAAEPTAAAPTTAVPGSAAPGSVAPTVASCAPPVELPPIGGDASLEITTTTVGPPAAEHADPPRFPTTVAVATGSATPVHASPGGPVQTTLRSPVPYSRMPQIFTVNPVADAPPGWLHVNLRTRPNGSTGWIRIEDVSLDSHHWSIDINLSARWATVYHGGEVFAATPVVIGTAASPTPTGDYYITEGVWTPSPGGAYGPFIYGLSAHSEVYTEFAGGDGQIGLHGTNQPQLLGSAASHGCVRFPNDVIRRMADSLPMGVPVHIHG